MLAQLLQGCRVLIVEHDRSLAEDLSAGVRDQGAEIVGPARDVETALSLIDQDGPLHGAVLNIDLQGETVSAITDALTARRIPFVFSTGSEAPADPLAPPALSGRGEAIDTERVLSTLAIRIASQDRQDPGASFGWPFARSLIERFRANLGEEIKPALREIELSQRQVLFEPGDLLDFVYFPETAVISLLAGAQGARSIEVGVVGCEGMTDLVMHEGDRAVLWAKATIAGSAWRLDADAFMQAMRSPAISRLMLAFKEALAIQFAQSALAHGTLTIEARLARTILMLDDRIEGDSIPIVHNDIAEALAVRRSGVTTALHVLEGMGAIRSIRGKIVVRDRAMLRELAGPSYGSAESEYARVMATAGMES